MNLPDAFSHAIALGNAREDHGELDAALECYRQALAIAPDNPRAYLNIGNALRAQQNHQGALAAVRSALLLDPGYAHAHFNLGLPSKIYENFSPFHPVKSCFLKSAYRNCGYPIVRRGRNGFCRDESIRPSPSWKIGH